MALLLGCIADDFTGATDLAALLARSGLPVSLRIGIPQEKRDRNETAAFEVIALKCRTSPVEIAVKQARQALEWLEEAGASRFFWKYCSTFDSTAEGNIGPVAEMLMAETGAAQTIYCPAFPENGRSVFMGHLFVGEQLLSESPMKDHPLTPMRDSSLVRLLTPQVNGAVGLASRNVVSKGAATLKARLAQLGSNGTQHVIVDAVCDDDLRTIAAASFDMPLLTGGSAIAGQLPQFYIEQGLISLSEHRQALPKVTGGSIVLSGSCSAMTRRQVANYAGKVASLRLDPIALAEEGAGAALEWLRQQSPDAPKLIYATAEPDEVRQAQERLGRDKAGQVVEDALSEIARTAFDYGTRRFVVAGGETSGAITQALGVTHLTIGPEIAPGVPWTFATMDGEPIALALKSGNFGGESFFTDAFDRLEAA
ncbi:four-carbon acid sugar kinase family protein [Rhizobium sp. P40RR-XXII]|uniref:3-oxo-tetronate kinase n=1 Tax=unclassified Rhizobium TaxID=2613769 RepID=UPI0014574B91|nr:MULTISPECIES: 3-oxo-tetronate kinase [unclassified Rhizobium]NLR86698.1 four-carbon acid sugar kinase family protein [Rhizobium sp. P28RR-XV]NLS17370.1 four-carbon acid sugar kinase family protein [Rhizobium sp. P40RR-XXII]